VKNKLSHLLAQIREAEADVADGRTQVLDKEEVVALIKKR
jgi:hypothetical protein